MIAVAEPQRAAMPESSPSAPSSSPPTTNPHTTPISTPARDSLLTRLLPPQRTRKQLTLLFAGATFATLSALLTRRALLRRHPAFHGPPKLFAPSNVPPRVPGPREALEALNLASLHVASWAILCTGGVLFAFDIGSLNEMRTMVRGGLGVDGSGRSEQEVEEEWEEWLAGVVERRRKKEERRRREQEGGNGGAEEEEEEWPDFKLEHRNQRGRPR